MILNQEKTDKLLALLKRRYPRWSGFSDQRFARDAAALKPDALEGIELLNEAGLRQLAAEHRWDEIIGRIDFVARSAAATTQDAPEISELEALHSAHLDKPLFCEAIIDLMFGEDDGPARLQRYANAAQAHNFPNNWALPTLLLMLVHPFTECFIKPAAVSWLLEFAGNPFSLGTLDGETYTRLVKLAREVAIHFEDGTMVEMPVLQRLIWLCYVESRSGDMADTLPLTGVAAIAKAAAAEAPAIPGEGAAVQGGDDFKIINIDKENEDPARARGRQHKEAALESAAFEMLEAMGTAPLSQKADKSLRDTALEKPALALVRDVLARLPERVRTQFFSVPLTAYGSERNRAFLNVSFYKKGGKWRGEPQLFFIFSEEGVECGYSIEWYMGVYLERFRANFTKNEPLMAAWLEDAASDQIGLKSNRVRGSDGLCAFRAESFISDNQEIRVSIAASREQMLVCSRTKLAATISESIVRLFPVLQLALDEDPFAEKPAAKTLEAVPAPAPVDAESTLVLVPAAAEAPESPAIDDERDVTLLEAEADLEDENAKPIEALAVEAAAEPALAAAIDAAHEAVESVLAEDESFDDAARLEPEEVWEMIAAEAKPIELKLVETPAEEVLVEASKVDEARTEEAKPVEVEAPAETIAAAVEEKPALEEKPANLLEVLAREVEGRSWTEGLTTPAAPPSFGPSRRIETETGAGSRVAAQAAEAAVLEEFEVLGIRHRANAAYPLAQCVEETGFPESQLSDWLSAIDRKGQAVFYGPPGTGKTFMAEKLARHLVSGGDGFSRLIQLHAGVGYEDFIEARRQPSAMGREAKSIAVPGRFVEFCREAEGRSGTCVLILDEMHRADIGTVIGELLYLLEHRDQELQLSGGTRFRVPSNVRVIGTMNTADRSNAFLDTAIRRRFAFLELAPRYEVLRHFHRMTEGMPVEELIAVLQSVNRRIANKRFEIGIAYFLRPDAAGTIESVWRTEIEPLISDYFFDQPGAADAFTWDAIHAHLA